MAKTRPRLPRVIKARKEPGAPTNHTRLPNRIKHRARPTPPIPVVERVAEMTDRVSVQSDPEGNRQGPGAHESSATPARAIPRAAQACGRAVASSTQVDADQIQPTRAVAQTTHNAHTVSSDERPHPTTGAAEQFHRSANSTAARETTRPLQPLPSHHRTIELGPILFQHSKRRLRRNEQRVTTTHQPTKLSPRATTRQPHISKIRELSDQPRYINPRKIPL